MRIESIKIQGFKSFRNESRLLFPERITAIVGPNGSGKSNIADAFRWVLGEQGLKHIRSKESTDVIFSGSNKLSKLSRAEVVITFTMDGEKSKPEETDPDAAPHSSLSEMAEVEIARKIYSDAASWYAINGSEARLLDIQLFLAEHNVGQKNYAVIGQGMIDEILKLSPADRLDFFYEATGVKKYQIKLHKAELKLMSSKERLEQAEAILKEITPHKQYLERQVGKYTKRKSILDGLREKQMRYYYVSYWNIEDALQGKKHDFRQLEGQYREMNDEVAVFDRKIALLHKGAGGNEEIHLLQSELTKLEYAKSQIKNKIAALSLEKETRLEQGGQYDTAFLNRRLQEVRDIIERITTEHDSLAKLFSETKRFRERKQEDLADIRSKIIQAKGKEEWSEEALIARLEEVMNVSEMGIVKQKLQHIIDQLKIKGDKSRLEELDQLAGEFSAECDELRVKAEIMNGKLELFSEDKKRYSEEAEDIHLKLLNHEKNTDTPWLHEVAKREEHLTKELRGIEKSIEEIGEGLSAFRERQEQVRVEMYESQKRYQSALEGRSHVEGFLQAVKIELAKLELQKEQLLEEMKEELDEVRLNLILDNRAAEPQGAREDIKTLRGEVKQLKKEAEAIGEVDEQSLKEYEGVKQRFDFLTSQTEDLGLAISSLKKICARLEKKIQLQFRERFDDLQREFSRYFKILFEGGSAGIEMVPVEDSSEQGIEIIAHPPGKKIRHTMTLSGGERSLVAVALICAIISSNPPPFVIVDEIDAALDEANSNRLADILKTLSKNTQLIIITHNRATMEVADVLYGVTMDEDGVSKLVGVKLEGYE